MISPGKLFINYYTQEFCLSHPFYGLAFDLEYNIFNFVLVSTAAADGLTSQRPQYWFPAILQMGDVDIALNSSYFTT